NALRKIYFIDAANGFAVGDNGTIIKSTDGGNSWQRMQVPTENLLNDCAVINKDLIYVVGFRGTILKYSK
ncbi:MAG TPA: YCF48-related protein, partial [Chitinophagaceae bacterium]|nr:YCF48-related protein [Chitinophagaceae bacterium]